MSTELIKAAKQALDNACGLVQSPGWVILKTEHLLALRRALEQHEFDRVHEALEKQAGIHVSQQPADYDQGWKDGYKHGAWASEQQPAAQWVGLTDDAVYAAAEIAWRAGWAACRDAEFVGEEAEDEAWGYQGATVAKDIEAKLREKNGGGV